MANSPESEKNDIDELSENAEDTNVSDTGGDITVPGISEDEKTDENSDENARPRGANCNLRPNPTPTLLMNTDTNRY